MNKYNMSEGMRKVEYKMTKKNTYSERQGGWNMGYLQPRLSNVIPIKDFKQSNNKIRKYFRKKNTV